MGRKASLGSSGGTTISGVHSVPAALRSPQQLKARRDGPLGSPTHHAHEEKLSGLRTHVLHSVHMERYRGKDSEGV